MSNKIIRSRKLDSDNKARKSIVSKVNDDAKKDNSEDKFTEEKVNVRKINKEEQFKAKEVENKSENSNNSENSNDNNKPGKPEKPVKKKGFKNFFMKLSIIGRIALVIYAILIIFFGYLIIDAVSNSGKVIYGSRQEPVKIISDDQVNQVKSALEKDLKAKSIDVSYIAYRFVVVIDLGENAKLATAKKINSEAYKVVNKVLPINEYFNSKDQLNNDIFIYSTNLVPTNYDQKSNFILQTYKNSKMSKPLTYDLMQYRNKNSSKEVIESIQKAQKSAGN